MSACNVATPAAKTPLELGAATADAGDRSGVDAAWPWHMSLGELASKGKAPEALAPDDSAVYSRNWSKSSSSTERGSSRDSRGGLVEVLVDGTILPGVVQALVDAAARRFWGAG
ncbi:unnamed protein product [Prorocentrum cordatum]|uniref:Peptidylprolyl isomerase n=1 Tax=Prorocentrum cordatum TaxID=2364126 RepID=A0ABN9UGS8_9DINO|nr:unnamed protein product [Polarella glacialis]